MCFFWGGGGGERGGRGGGGKGLGWGKEGGGKERREKGGENKFAAGLRQKLFYKKYCCREEEGRCGEKGVRLATVGPAEGAMGRR